jgi:transcriptional regulator with XRE-family HTH domain
MLLARMTLLGWTQKELAQRMGRNQGHVSRVFSGERDSALFFSQAESVIRQAETKAKKRPRG